MEPIGILLPILSPESYPDRKTGGFAGLVERIKPKDDYTTSVRSIIGYQLEDFIRRDQSLEDLNEIFYREYPVLEMVGYTVDDNWELVGLKVRDEAVLAAIAKAWSDFLVEDFGDFRSDSSNDEAEYLTDALVAMAFYLRDPDVVKPLADCYRRATEIDPYLLDIFGGGECFFIEELKAIQHLESIEELNQALIAKREWDPSNG